MKHIFHPSSAFHFLSNRATDRGYILHARGKKGGLVNCDALDLLVSDDPAWQSDPAYDDFLEKVVSAGWLTADLAQAKPVVRFVDRPVHLQRVQYEINLVCNLECAHCYCSSSPRAPHGQSTEFVLDVVAQAAKLGVLNFDVTGGEPLVRADALEILRSIGDHGMIPGLYTNGVLVNHEKARALRDAGVVWAQTSLDARTPALHDEIRGKKGAFAKTVRAVKEMQDVGIDVRVAVCLNRRNAHEVREIVDFLRDDLKVTFGLDRVIPAGRGCSAPEPLALPNEEYYAIMQRYFGGTKVAAKGCDAIGLGGASDKINPGCGVGASYLFIKHDGRAALCPTLTEAESPDFVQADLKTMSLEEAWEAHPTFTAYRGMQCENAQVCPSGRKCGGGCRSNAYLLHGRLDSPDEVHCNIYKNPETTYRPMLLEYEEMRREGKLPARRTSAPSSAAALRMPRRLLKVVG